MLATLAIMLTACSELQTYTGINPATVSDMLMKKGYQDEACRILEGHLENHEVMRRLGLIKKRQKQYSQALELFITKEDSRSKY